MSNTSNSVRAGIVGSGFAARFHVEALRKVYGLQVEIAGVYSPTAGNCRKFALEAGLKPYPSLASLVE
ncbi:MAG: Gfo/Idh/MocA family oxidoreductase, partial [Desulfofustis sp.]|nr:Gfo/Idh/MocA family oxidoreductase [Desulfofustis sp.]